MTNSLPSDDADEPGDHAPGNSDPRSRDPQNDHPRDAAPNGSVPLESGSMSDDSIEQTSTLGDDDVARLTESTVDSIEEALREHPAVHPGNAIDETMATLPSGAPTKPFGIDLGSAKNDAHESAKTADPAAVSDSDSQEDPESSDLDDTHSIESPNDSSATVSLGTGKSQSLEQAEQTLRLEDTATENAMGATVQFDSDVIGKDTIIRAGGFDLTDESGSASLDQNDIGQTINPRELSGKDADFWGSLLKSGSGQLSQPGEATKISPAIERSISETKLQVRVRKMVTPKQDMDQDADYRLVKLLGKGGMGNVFVARQSSLDRLVAVKVIKPLAQKKRDKLEKQGKLKEVESDRRQQFLSEAVVTGDLDHPNIVPIHDIAVTADNTLFYAMKRVVGTPWSKVIDQKTRDENLDILLRTADAIGFAHTRGVVHRDIKPENIMLGDFGVVLVMDWGLALAKPEFEKIESITHTAGLGGTPAFMAPEMATGPMSKIGPRSDIYLLGATLFLIITGRPPHLASNISACIKAVAKNEISGDIESYRGELMNIALQAMAKAPEDRYPDVQSFQKAIRDYRSHAESIALATRADEDAALASQQRDYMLFSRAIYGYEQSLELWPDNEPAQEGLRSTTIAHASAALENEDFDLGVSLLNAEDPDHKALLQQLYDGQQERELRQSRLTLFKRAVAAMLLFILVGGAIAFYFINDQRNQAIAAKGLAEELTKTADARTREVNEEKDKVEVQKKIAEQKTQEAILSEAEALKQKAEAIRQKAEALKQKNAAERNATTAKNNAEIALQNAKKAREGFAEANRQRGIADQKAAEARREQQNAEYEVYLSQIGLAKAKIERNEFDEARQILNDLKTIRGTNRLGWEWRWLSRRANQSTLVKRTDSSLVDLDLSESGETGVALSENGAIHLIRISSDGQPQSQQIAPVHPLIVQAGRPTAAAISADGGTIALGFASGEIQLWDSSMRQKIRSLLGHEQTITDLRFSGARSLISGSLDKTARVWDAQTGRATATLWHIAPVRQIASTVSTDGQQLIAAAVADSASGRAVVWQRTKSSNAKSPSTLAAPKTGLDLSNRKHSGEFERAGEFLGHDRPLASIAISPDGTLAASGDIGGNVLLWRPSRLKRTDFKSAIAGAIQQTSGKSNTDKTRSVVQTNRVSATPFAKLVDRSLRPETRQLVSTAPNLISPTVISTTTAHRDLVQSITFSSAGNRILTTAHDYTIKIWDADSRQLSKVLRGHGGWVTDARFRGADPNRVLSISKDASIRSWEIATNPGEASETQTPSAAQTTTKTNDRSRPHDDEIWSARFDPTGQRIVTASRDHTARVLRVNRETMTFREVAKLQLADRQENESNDKTIGQLTEGTAFRAMSVAVDRVNGRVFVGSADATVRIWDLVRGTQIDQLRGTGLNRTLALSANGRLLLTGSSSPQINAILWGIDPQRRKAPERLLQIKGHQQAVTAFAISPDGRTLFTGDRIGIGYFWNSATGQQIGKRVSDTRGYRINDACFSPDGKELLIVADDENLTRIDVGTGLRIDRFAHQGFATAVSVSSDGRQALTVSEFSSKKKFVSQVVLWDLRRQQKRVLDQINWQRDKSLTDELPEPTEASNEQSMRFLSARFAADNQSVIISRSNGDRKPGTLSITDIQGESANAKNAKRLQLPSQLGAAEVAMPLPGNHLLTLNADAAFLWDLETMTHRKSYRAHAAVTQASFSFDGKYIATGSRSLKIWDAETGAAIGKLESPHQGAVLSVQFRRSGPEYVVATAGEDGVARVWRWQPTDNTFSKSAEFSISEDASVAAARVVCFSPQGDQLLVAGDDGRARVWNLNQPSTEITYDQSDAISFDCATFSADGQWIALGGTDKKARLFRIAASTKEVTPPITLRGHSDAIKDIAIIQDASDEMRVLTASSDKSTRLWDPRINSSDRRAREILTLRNHSLGVTAVDATSDGDLVLTASRDGSVVLWPASKSEANRDEPNLFEDLSNESNDPIHAK